MFNQYFWNLTDIYLKSSFNQYLTNTDHYLLKTNQYSWNLTDVYIKSNFKQYLTNANCYILKTKLLVRLVKYYLNIGLFNFRS